MTLDEVINHANEVANTCEDAASKYDMTDAYESHVACQEGKCAEEHRQLAEWLKELKQLRERTIWIPADESPKTSGRYLVVYGGTNLVGIDSYTTEKEAKEIFGEGYEAFAGWNSQNVIKWMQLPESEPYKVESDG